MIKNQLIIIIVFLFLFACGKNRNDSQENDFKFVLVDNNIKHLPDSNKILLLEFVIINDNFKIILDSIINEYQNCESSELGYHFSITIQKAIIKDSLGIKSIQIDIDSLVNEKAYNAKSIYISRSYYKGYITNGYGFFYYKKILFSIEGQYMFEVFKESGRKRVFRFKNEPIAIFDPPRWLYCFRENEFYFAYSSPCGG